MSHVIHPLISYDAVFSNFYDQYFGGYSEKISPLLLKFFYSPKLKNSDRTLLDVGCGSGRLILHFLSSGFKMIGIDNAPEMIVLTQQRCWHFWLMGQLQLIQNDMASMELNQTVDGVFSTYNSMNHLETEEKLPQCFRHVRAILKEGGFFIFDFHTLQGLQDWNTKETAVFQEDAITIERFFDVQQGKATMHLEGHLNQDRFDTWIVNYSIPMNQLLSLLHTEGFSRVVLTRIDHLDQSVMAPEQENRVVVIAS
jgi:SAM-dependent methyltransferase